MSYQISKDSLAPLLARCLLRHGSMEAIHNYISEYSKTGQDATACPEFIATFEISKQIDREEIIEEAKALAEKAEPSSHFEVFTASRFLNGVSESKALIERVERLILDGKNTAVSDEDCKNLMKIWALGKKEVDGGIASSLLEDFGDFDQKFHRIGLLVRCCGVDLDHFGETVSQLETFDESPLAEVSSEMSGANSATSDPVVSGSRLTFYALAMAVWCVVLALADFHNQWIYDLSKWVLCAGCLYLVLDLWKSGMRRRLIPLGMLAVIFNPLAPIRFQESEWQVVDWIAAAVLLLYLPKLRSIARNMRAAHWVVASLGSLALWGIITFANYTKRMEPVWTGQREEREAKAKATEEENREKRFRESAAGKMYQKQLDADLDFKRPAPLEYSTTPEGSPQLYIK